MEWKNLENICINTGAPCPKVLASDNSLYLLFYSVSNSTKATKERNSVNDKGVSIVKFENYLSFNFGYPNDEVFCGHPLFNKGLKIYTGQVSNNTAWIEELKNIGRVHPYYSDSKFNQYRHYLFSFHDTTFECLAVSHSVLHKELDLYDASINILQEIFLNEFE